MAQINQAWLKSAWLKVSMAQRQHVLVKCGHIAGATYFVIHSVSRKMPGLHMSAVGVFVGHQVVGQAGRVESLDQDPLQHGHRDRVSDDPVEL